MEELALRLTHPTKGAMCWPGCCRIAAVRGCLPRVRSLPFSDDMGSSMNPRLPSTHPMCALNVPNPTSCGRWTSRDTFAVQHQALPSDSSLPPGRSFPLQPGVAPVPTSRETRSKTASPHVRRYGLPQAMLMDNGSPWGSDNSPHRLAHLGISVHHSRPYHPQTLQTGTLPPLTEERSSYRSQFTDLPHCQRASTPGVTSTTWSAHTMPWTSTTSHTPSGRPFPEALPTIDYAPDDHVQFCGCLRSHLSRATTACGKSLHA